MIIVFLALIIFASPVFAADITITCPNDSSASSTDLTCTKSDTLPLFSYQNIMPGFLTSPPHSITVENQDIDNPCFLKAETIKNSADSLLLEGTDRLNLSIVSNSSLLYSGPLIFTNLNLGQVDIGSTKSYYWTVSFPESAGNEYQNLSANFDINLNFSCANNPTWQSAVTNPTTGVFLSEFMPDVTSPGNEWIEIINDNDFPVILSGWKIKDNSTTAKSVNISIDTKSFYVLEFTSGYLNNNGDIVNLINHLNQTVESVSYSKSNKDTSWSKQPGGSWCQTPITKGYTNDSCSDADTVSTPASSGTVLGQSSSSSPTCADPKPATPTGLSVTSALNSANLSWDPLSAPISSYLIAYGPSPDNILYGNPNIGLSTNYTVNGLTSGAQYCFYVRGQNGCMPGDASEIVCINTGSNIPIVETEPPVGFQPEVLGENTDNSEINQVVLEKDIKLPHILGDSTSSCTTSYFPLLFILAFILNCLIFHQNPQFNLFLPFLISLTTFIIDYFLLKKFCCHISLLCRFYFLGNITSFFFPKIIFNQSKK